MLEKELVGITITAAAIGSFFAAGIATARASAARSGRSRRNPAQVFLGGNDRSEPLTENELYRLGRVPWSVWSALAFLAGALFAYHQVGELSPVLVIWGAAGALVSRVVRAYVISRRQAEIDRQVRDLVSLAWRALALGSELGAALNEIVPLLRPGVVRERLEYHLERTYPLDPAYVIECLARDVRAIRLESLALAARAAARASRGYQAVVLCPPRTLACGCSQNTCLGPTPADPALLIVDPWQAQTMPETLPAAQGSRRRTVTGSLALGLDPVGQTQDLVASDPYLKVETRPTV